MKKISNEIETYELINSIFKVTALCLGEIAGSRDIKKDALKDIINSLEDLYYRVVSSFESRLGTTLVFDIAKYDSIRHPDSVIDSFLKVLNFKPAFKKD